MASIDIKGLTIRLPVIGADQRSFKRQITRTVGGTLGRINFTPFVAALQNVNLQLKSGDRLGLVGHNGAGKTTLLRTIAGAYAPDEGVVEVEGRVAALLDLMAGIDTFATGLESIRMRGMVLGMTRKQIQERAEEIAEFSGLGPYLGMPIKSYSSGMLARLAFAITTAVDTEILLMDEWLGVGDQDFRDKAQKRLVELVDSAKIFVLASHDATLIRKMCDKFVVLHSGRASHVMTAHELDDFMAETPA
jgi:lipopolysaccharide transport system ATP-binding protein